jgi:integrase
VFLSPTKKGPVRSIWKATASIRENSGVDFVPHDMRRTAASRMTGDLGVSRLTVSKILNHVESGVTAVYDRHSYDREKREALDAWGSHLIKIVENERASIGSKDGEQKVVTLHAG